MESSSNCSQKTFGDYVRLYNNLDVVGLIQVIEEMLKIERENKLDPFKEAVSLPGLTQHYLFQNLDKGDYFVGIGPQHKHLYKMLRESVVGGPSIIFHRYHAVGKTLIKGEHPCQKIIGFDANSLYLYCLGQDMPVGFYSVREKENNFAKEARFSDESIQWLEYLNTEEGAHIQHAKNGGEVRKGNYVVDGWDPTTQTCYEYNGCYFHGHSCNAKYHNATLWERTITKEADLRKLGYNVVSITSCQWFREEASKKRYDVPNVADTLTKEEILSAVREDQLFGFVKCSLHVPEAQREHFAEFPPIFKNTSISLEDVGPHMRAYCETIGRKTGVKRSLISSMHAENIFLLTPLLKKYLEMGLEVTDISTVIEYQGKAVFSWFMDKVCNDRRRADLDPTYKSIGETSKLKGNSGYGSTLTDRSKHAQTTFADVRNVPIHVSNPRFK